VLCRHSITLGPWEFVPGAEQRAFVEVPLGASWAEMALRAAQHDVPKLFMLHATQLLPHTRPQQHRQSLTVSGGAAAASVFAVAGGEALEIVLAQFWKTAGASRVAVDVAFHGLTVAPERPVLQGCEHVAEVMVRVSRRLALWLWRCSAAPWGPRPRVIVLTVSQPHWATVQRTQCELGALCVQVHAPLRRTKVQPAATLNKLHIPLRPATAQLTTLGTLRDALPGDRIMHRLLLSYKLKLAEGGAIVATLPALRAAVYDGALEGQLFAIYDANKKRLNIGDVYPEVVTVAKGACAACPLWWYVSPGGGSLAAGGTTEVVQDL
jgi:tripeptidyl-peptidase II